MTTRALSPLAIAILAVASACSGADDSTAKNDLIPPGSKPPPAGQTPTSGQPASTGVTPPAPGEPVRFVAMGDTGTGTDAQKKVANAVEAKCKRDGCHFVQLLGDNLYDSGAESVDDEIWQSNFEVPYAAIELPFYAVLGNHDYGNGGMGTDFPRGKIQVDYTQSSTKWKMPAAYYHVAHNTMLEIFGLDTNMQLFGQAAAQKSDVTSWIAQSTSRWKIAVGHHPYLSNGPHGNAGNYEGIPFYGKTVKDFMDNVVCGKVDLYIAGHDHSRQWLNASCKGTELAVSGAGAKATELTERNPVLFASLELGFLYLVAEQDTLTCEFVDEEGNVEFTHVIKK